jgi:hypothetical protein
MSGNRPTTLERAFALAEAGQSMTEIRNSLKAEGYDQHQLSSPMLVRQLNQRSRKARSLQP